MIRIKAVLIGDSSVGKTCISQRILHGSFVDSISSTIGSANTCVEIKGSKRSVQLSLWDTAGQERYRSLSSIYYRGAGIAFLVFDLTQMKSFQSLWGFYMTLKDNIDPKSAIIVVGNKADLETERVVHQSDIQDFLEKIGARFYAETSALTGIGITELFSMAIDLEGIPFEHDSLEIPEYYQKDTSITSKRKCCLISDW